MIIVTCTSWNDGIETQDKETALRFVRESSWHPERVSKFFDENWNELLTNKYLKYEDIEMEVM